jgi:hypothetical protein
MTVLSMPYNLSPMGMPDLIARRVIRTWFSLLCRILFIREFEYNKGLRAGMGIRADFQVEFDRMWPLKCYRYQLMHP